MKETNPKITAIIPAYNEELRISTVLETVVQTKIIDEIIVVNDGSTDQTAEVVKEFSQVRLIDNRENKGKGAALMAGIEHNNSNILVFIDADLVGLQTKHIEDLIKPLFEDDQLMMTVGKFSGGRFRTDISQLLLPFISGQRAVRRSFLEGIDFSDTRFGAEIALTRHAKLNGAKVEEVIMDDVTHVMKEEKLGVIMGAWARLGMYSDMLKHYVSNYFRQQ